MHVLASTTSAVGSGRLDSVAVLSAPALRLLQVLLRQNEASGSGGAVAVHGLPSRRPRVRLEGSTLLANACPGGGGGGLAASEAELVVVESVLEANVAAEGGGLHLVGCASLLNTSQVRRCNATRGGGGGVAVHQGSLVAASSTLDANTALGGGDGGEGGGGEGGALLLNTTTVATLDQCTLASNRAAHGGGLAALASPAVALTRCELAHNRALVHGAGAFASASELTISRSELRANAASGGGGGGGGGGGACGVLGSLLSLRDSVLAENSCDACDGGGVMLTRSTLAASNSTFTANAARHGGAVYLWDQGSAPPTFDECNFTANRAVPTAAQLGGEGGALYFHSAGLGEANPNHPIATKTQRRLASWP